MAGVLVFTISRPLPARQGRARQTSRALPSSGFMCLPAFMVISSI
jgi:hypothetical protein